MPRLLLRATQAVQHALRAGLGLASGRAGTPTLGPVLLQQLLVEQEELVQQLLVELQLVTTASRRLSQLVLPFVFPLLEELHVLRQVVARVHGRVRLQEAGRAPAVAAQARGLIALRELRPRR